jgi:AraC-type DNA-binding domain-containing proteins
VIQQTTTPVKIFLAIGMITLAVVLVIIAVVNICRSRHSRNLGKESDQLRLIRASIRKLLSDPALSVNKVSAATGLSIDSIESTLRDETDSSFEHLVEFKRIETAKTLLRDLSLSLESITERCGYTSVDEMKEAFHDYMHATPESFRSAIQEMTTEEDEDSPSSRIRLGYRQEFRRRSKPDKDDL